VADNRVIAVLGTGIMGAPMARNLCRAGFEVRVWNRTRAKAEPLAAEGASVADTPARAAAGAHFVMTVLTDGRAVEDTMNGVDGAFPAMGSDAVWLQCSTVGLAATERLAALAARNGVAFVDAPVLGTKKPAEDGTLNVLASGAADLEEACRGVFEAIGQRYQWLGPAGTGSKLKLVINSWVLAVVGAASEAIALAEGLGLDPRLFLSTLEGSQLDTPYVHLKGEAMIRRDFTASFPTSGAAKDIGLIIDAATQVGVSADVARAVAAKFDRTIELGHGDDDMAAAYYASAG
jgi:3-hydroxyisobutyrate dehydrogenase